MTTSPDTGREGHLPAFGRWLARERELRGQSRDEVVRATRLAPAVVEALESGDAIRFPPRAYAVGYVRAYAAALGLDPDEAVLRYEEAAGPGDAARAPRRRAPRRRAVLLLAAVLVAAAAAAAVAWLALRG
jgi:cytoskeletal protein RodZ